MPTPALIPVVIPAPSDLEGGTFAHKLSGAIVQTRTIAFRVSGDDVEPINYPAIPEGDMWEPVIRTGPFGFTAHGYTGTTIESLSAAIRNRRPT